MWKPFPRRHVFKTLRESPKRTISASGELRLLQMVLEPNTGQCTSEEVESRRGVDTRQCASKDAGSRKGWIWGVPHRLEKGNECQQGRQALKGVDCEIPYWLERRTNHSL